ncbi:MAG: mechanosensitive ion channel [Alphaproteobacteria bacterium]|nr:mechanosensitive ion channel [Alphaproteobacteria bacterium]
MKKISCIFLAFVFLSLGVVSVTQAAAPVAAPAQQEEPAAPVISSTPNLKTIDNAIGQRLQALVTSGDSLEVEPQETFGTRSLGLILTLFEALRAHGESFFTNFTAVPQVGAWLNQQYNDVVLSARWADIGQLLALVLGGAVAMGMLAQFALSSPRLHLIRRHNHNFAERLASSAGWLILSLVSMVLFVGTALILMNESAPPRLERYVVMNVIYAIALQRMVRLLANFLLAPYAPRLRIVPLGDSYSRYLQLWIRRISFVMVYGYFCIDVARLVRVPAATIASLNSLLGLVIVVMAIVIIVQKRSLIAMLIRGDITPSMPNLNIWQSLRLWLARIWHQLAIAYLVIGYAITMLGVGGGFSLMLRGTILTLVILVVMRMLLHAVAGFRTGAGANISRLVLRSMFYLSVWMAAVLSIVASWGVDVSSILFNPWGQRVTGSALFIIVTILVAAVGYESLYSYIDRKLNPKDSSGRSIAPSARSLTLLPLARNAALITIIGVVSLMILSELGVNIAPLLAGAGVIGVAIGFGSQSLVKDFITGLFILMEDTIAIGDAVKIGDHSGVVESMTIRTIRLRSVNGDLHILPFSEVTMIVNSTKDFAYAVMDIGVAYDSDLQHVIKSLKEVGEALREVPAYINLIIEPIEIFGVEQLADSAVIIRCRLKTLPGKQWEIRRAFLLRVKEKFDVEKIEIPYPTVKHIAAAPIAAPEAVVEDGVT